MSFHQEHRISTALGELELLLGQRLHHRHLTTPEIKPAQAPKYLKALRRDPDLLTEHLRARIGTPYLWSGMAFRGQQGRGQRELDIQLMLHTFRSLWQPLQHL